MPNPQYIQQAKKVRMYYDPRGQVVRTVNPDATEQWVLFGRPPVISGIDLNTVGLPAMYDFTPWESYTFDANDLVQFTHPTQTTADLAKFNANPTNQNRIQAAVNRQNNLAKVRNKISPLSRQFSAGKKSFEKSLEITKEIIDGKRELGSSTDKKVDRWIPYRGVIKWAGIAGLAWAAASSLDRIVDSGFKPTVMLEEAGGWAGAYMVGVMAAAGVAALGAVPALVLAAGIAGGMLGFYMGSGMMMKDINNYLNSQ